MRCTSLSLKCHSYISGRNSSTSNLIWGNIRVIINSKATKVFAVCYRHILGRSWNSQKIFWRRVDIKNMSITFNIMTLIILPQIKFEEILSNDVGGVAFQAEADVLHHILGICHNSFSLVAHMALILKILKRSFQTCMLVPTPLIYVS